MKTFEISHLAAIPAADKPLRWHSDQTKMWIEMSLIVTGDIYISLCVCVSAHRLYQNKAKVREQLSLAANLVIGSADW